MAALVTNGALRTLVRALAHVPDAFDPFTWPPVVVATLVGVIGGGCVYAVIRTRLGPRADRTFAVVAYGLMIVSLITPVTLLWSVPPQYPGTSLLTVGSLECMHVSTAVATVVAFTWHR